MSVADSKMDAVRKLSDLFLQSRNGMSDKRLANYYLGRNDIDLNTLYVTPAKTDGLDME